MISVMVLQNHMDLLKGELGPGCETCVMSTRDGSEVTGINVERVTDMTEEEDQEPATIPLIKTEPKVSCMSVVTVRYISYRLYPGLPLYQSVPVNKILTPREWILSSFVEKIVLFCDTACEVPLAIECFIHQ